MHPRCRLNYLVGLLLSLSLFLTSCGGEKLCAGLNNGTGSANTPKAARKKSRGGYKSPRELDARDRQQKRIRKSQRRTANRKAGKKNTTGKKKGLHIGFRLKSRRGSVHASGKIGF